MKTFKQLLEILAIDNICFNCDNMRLRYRQRFAPHGKCSLYNKDVDGNDICKDFVRKNDR